MITGSTKQDRKQSFRSWGMILCLLLLFVCSFAGSKEVHAAAKKVSFTDQSGKYIKVRNTTEGNTFYLYDKTGKVLTGVQYLKIPKIDTGIQTGYYMFNTKGKLIRNQNIYYLPKQRVHGVTFDGYYYANKNGCFRQNPYGLCWAGSFTCSNGTKFHGFYYLQEYGKINAKPQCRYIEKKTIKDVTFESGYYWFTGSGMLNENPMFHTIRKEIHATSFNGCYFFDGPHGKLMQQKRGLKKINDKTYYLAKWSRRVENTWVSGHYFLSDGTMATNMKTPDGKYVDKDGNKITKDQFEMGTLKNTLTNTLSGYSGTWSVYVKNLDTGSVLEINNQPLYAASVIKPFVMASTFDQIKKGKLGYSETIKSLLWDMITESDNEAYNQLVRYNSNSRDFLDGASVVNSYIHTNGYTDTVVHHTLHPASSSYISDGSSNSVSVRDAGKLLENIYNGTCVDAAYSQAMLNLLLNQQRRWKIPASLPSGIRIANKTGETNTTQHDMAIVYGPKTTYIVCIFSRNVSEYYGINGIKTISRSVYDYLNQ